MKHNITFKDDLILLTVTCAPTKDPLTRYKLGNSYARKILAEHGHDAVLVKSNMLISQHDETSEATWRFRIKNYIEPTPETEPTPDVASTTTTTATRKKRSRKTTRKSQTPVTEE